MIDFEQWWQENYPQKPNQSAQSLATLAFAKEAARKAFEDAQPQWQPIETAPKDGTKIIVSNGRFAKTAYWGGKRPPCWKCDAGYSLGEQINWMPIPAPPTE